MFLDCVTKPCSVVVSRIASDSRGDMRIHDAEKDQTTLQKKNLKWVVRNSEDSCPDGKCSPLKKTLKIVRDYEGSFRNKVRKVSPLTLYTHIENGLVTEVCCKRFKRRRVRTIEKMKGIGKMTKRMGLNDVKMEEDYGVRDVMDRLLHQVTLETMDGVEMTRLVRNFCRDHGFNDSDFDDPAALLQPCNVVTEGCEGYGGVLKKTRRHKRRRLKTFVTRSVAARRVTSTPPKTGIVYISDSDETDTRVAECRVQTDDQSIPSSSAEKKSLDSAAELVNRSSSDVAEGEVVVILPDKEPEEAPMDTTSHQSVQPERFSVSVTEALPKKRLFGMTAVQDNSPNASTDSVVCDSPKVPDHSRPNTATTLEESILRTLLLDATETENVSKSPLNSKGLPVISDVVSLSDDKKANEDCDTRDSPEIVEVKVHTVPERQKTTADVVHNLRLEIAALERLAAEKERERRLLLYFKSCKEELLKRLTPDPLPPQQCKSDIFSSVKRMSESSSFRPYPQTDSVNSYKSLMLTTAGQWSTAPLHQYNSLGAPLQRTDLLRTKTSLWPCYPLSAMSHVPANKNQWRSVPPNLVGQFPISTRAKQPLSVLPQCVVCRVVKAAFLCSGCGKEWYCSEFCQRQNWKHHSRNCSS